LVLVASEAASKLALAAFMTAVVAVAAYTIMRVAVAVAVKVRVKREAARQEVAEGQETGVPNAELLEQARRAVAQVRSSVASQSIRARLDEAVQNAVNEARRQEAKESEEKASVNREKKGGAMR
jgi:hypothetical protein